MDDAELFLAASQIEDCDVREAFLVSLCKSDDLLLSKLRKLLVDFDRWKGSLDDFTENLPNRIANIQSEEMEPSMEGELSAPEIVSRNSLQPGARFAAYEISDCLGIGGMGEVYLARDIRLHRNVALKILPKRHTLNPSWVSRFHREARAASALNHPNILTIYEIGDEGGCPFISTEFVDGLNLRQLMGQRKLEWRDSLKIASQVAEALLAAHSANVVHRDIKPENIMIREDGLVKILDFGLAKSIKLPSSLKSTLTPTVDGDKTEPGLLMGTPKYMSPEQARGRETDGRSDIFSFGVLLFELLSSKHPFAGATDADVLAAVIRKEAPSLRSLIRGLPIELDLMVAKMLRKDPERRFQSMRDVLIELKQWTGHAPDDSADEDLDVWASVADYSQSDEATVERNDDTQFEIPQMRYARSGHVNIAYQVLGKGDIDIVFVMGWVSHLDWFWKEPSFARFLKRLASFARLILFDKRGTGLSDRVQDNELPTLEQRMEDVQSVMNAVGSEKAVLCGVSEGGPMCALFAATYPQRTLALVMIGSYARRLRSPDYPWGPSEAQHALFLEDIRKNWGGPVGIESRAPSRANDMDFRTWWATYLRMGASPGAALALTKMNAQIDIRAILKTIQVPTLVIHRQGDKCLLIEEGEYLANNIPGSKFVPLPGDDHLPFVGNQEDVLMPIEKFLTGVTHNSRIQRVLATVLYAKLSEDSFGTVQPSRSIALSHAVRDIELFRGKPYLLSKDAFAGTFHGPAQAIRAAMAIGEAANRLGARLQIGVHTGECEIHESSIAGPAIDTAKLIAECASHGEILASGTVKDLVAGADLCLTLWKTEDESAPVTRLFRVDC